MSPHRRPLLRSKVTFMRCRSSKNEGKPEVFLGFSQCKLYRRNVGKTVPHASTLTQNGLHTSPRSAQLGSKTLQVAQNVRPGGPQERPREAGRTTLAHLSGHVGSFKVTLAVLATHDGLLKATLVVQGCFMVFRSSPNDEKL